MCIEIGLLTDKRHETLSRGLYSEDWKYVENNQGNIAVIVAVDALYKITDMWWSGRLGLLCFCNGDEE